MGTYEIKKVKKTISGEVQTYIEGKWYVLDRRGKYNEIKPKDKKSC